MFGTRVGKLGRLGFAADAVSTYAYANTSNTQPPAGNIFYGGASTLYFSATALSGPNLDPGSWTAGTVLTIGPASGVIALPPVFNGWWTVIVNSWLNSPPDGTYEVSVTGAAGFSDGFSDGFEG